MSENHLEETLNPEVVQEPQKKYWLSLEQWANDPEFKKRAEEEFQSSPLRDGSDKEDGWARREFLKLMGASLALASSGCIRRPVQKIIPYSKQPEEVTFGVPQFYTSTFFDQTEGHALLVRTREGRPIKIGGNPDFPLNGNGLSSRAQAFLLSLYDPERIKGPLRNLQNKTRTNRDTVHVKWEDADKAIADKVKESGTFAILTGNIASPATRAVIGDFSQAFGAKHYSWEVVNFDAIKKAQELSYGEALVPFYNFENAQMVVSINADFLGSWLMPTTFSRGFAAGRRKLNASMTKLVVFDSAYSLTGGNADQRFRIAPSDELKVLRILVSLVSAQIGRADAGRNSPNEDVAGISADQMKEVAANLVKAKGKSLVVSGSDSVEAQVLVNALNSMLENDGVTVQASRAQTAITSTGDGLTNLIAAIEKGEIKRLLIHQVNPFYSYADVERFKEAIKKLDLLIYTGDRNDETGIYADYILPDHHSLEGWNDGEFQKGLYCLHQPTIRPLYDTRSFQLTLMTWAYLNKMGSKRLQSFETYYDFLRDYWKTDVQSKVGSGGKTFEAFWDDALEKGFVGTVANGGSARKFRGEGAVTAGRTADGPAAEKKSDYEYYFYPSASFNDGTLNNVSWLQELPDPVTKIVWDNYASVSIATAEKLKVKEGSKIELTIGGTPVILPVHIQPGLHDRVITAAIGYGRTGIGQVGNDIGVNLYPALKAKWSFAGGIEEVHKLDGENYELACVQGHHTMEGRQIVAETSLAGYLKDKKSGQHEHKIFSIWDKHAFNGHKWGMSIDLNICTGCSGCVIACQSENNIPVVGKKFVLQGREMHWIRIDRYYSGDPANPSSVFQPLLCQHCDNAPCETVCPVLATVHSDEGLNDMVYNRCVGTRYCSNNCPYKVRRFNWFNYTKKIEKPLNLALNPDVTVRSRGVMEKCTFCVHRIKAGKNKAKLERRDLKDGDIKTACQESCPSNAITFGDMNDPESEVSKMFQDERAYSLLGEFNFAPAVRYMTKVNNVSGDGAEGTGQGEHA